MFHFFFVSFNFTFIYVHYLIFFLLKNTIFNIYFAEYLLPFARFASPPASCHHPYAVINCYINYIRVKWGPYFILNNIRSLYCIGKYVHIYFLLPECPSISPASRTVVYQDGQCYKKCVRTPSETSVSSV